MQKTGAGVIFHAQELLPASDLGIGQTVIKEAVAGFGVE
jgi:hypothetical protein